MITNSYDVELDDEVRHIDIAEVRRREGAPPEFIEPPAQRSSGMLCLDAILLLLIFLLPVMWLLSTELFLTHLAVVLAIILGGYFKLICRILTAMGPPDAPQVIAVINVPEQLHCPRCGAAKTHKYCSCCGVNVERQYRKMVRKLAQYAVQETADERQFLETSLRYYLQDETERHRREIAVALEKLERNYVVEIARQRKELRRYQQRLLVDSRPTTEDVLWDR